jgi:hypothetical protein
MGAANAKEKTGLTAFGVCTIPTSNLKVTASPVNSILRFAGPGA